MAAANTHTAAKWSVLPEQMQQMGRIPRILCTIQLVASFGFAFSLQYNSHPLYNTTRHISCIFSAIQLASSCTIQLVASFGFAYSLQYKSHLLSLQFTSCIFCAAHISHLRLFVAIPVKITIFLLPSPETITDFQVISHYCRTCCINAQWSRCQLGCSCGQNFPCILSRSILSKIRV